MTGSHEITVQNRRLKYKFTVCRNITILRGDSATGKTTLIDMIEEYQRNGNRTGIELKCDKKCIVLGEDYWDTKLRDTKDSIVFIDEGYEYIDSEEFAHIIKDTDNYYVIATRGSLFNIPYSIKEIYGIKNVSGNRYQGTKRLYSEIYRLYNDDFDTEFSPEIVFVEDSKAGYEFFQNYFKRFNIECETTNGNSGVYDSLVKSKKSNILIIVDGAAFGPYIEQVKMIGKNKNIFIYMPESFEWMILSSGLIKSGNVSSILERPYDFIESKDYFTWERFFTDILRKETRGTYLQYKKESLNRVYLQEDVTDKVVKGTPLEEM